MANTGTSTPEIEENTQPGSGRDSARAGFHDQLDKGFWNVQIDSVKKAILEAEASVSPLELKMNKRIAQVLLEGLMNIWENRRVRLTESEIFSDSITIKSFENRIIALNIKVTTFEEQEKERVEVELKIAKAKGNVEGVPGTSFPLGKKKNAYLPKLPLATFKGELLQWPSFIDFFESSIDKNPNLSLVEKMQYLKAACSGPAARVIEWFPIEEKNYQIALDALKEHFGSPEMMDSALVKVIKGLSPLKSIKPVLAVKKRLALMSGYARRLGWYDEKKVVLAKTVIPEILDKLPPLLTVQYQIESKKDPEKRKVKNMFAYLVDLIKSYHKLKALKLQRQKKILMEKEDTRINLESFVGI
uniref:Uncharacterized protein n=1 Tax=Strigamia maritima TaxID=126957 RepID=T1IQY6_STRMM